MKRSLVPAMALAMLAGCQTTDAVFVGTYTRVGIDASAASSGGGIGYKNVAMTIQPPKANGGSFDVVGTADMDLAITHVALSEMVATGQAALCASGSSEKKADLLQAAASEKVSKSPLIFATSTYFTLFDLSWGDAAGSGINFGYKRTVGVRMPVQSDSIGSVYANVHINSTDTKHGEAEKSELGGTRSTYVFATGQAAVNMAAKDANKLTGNVATAGCS